jgi:malonate-semialdehyde dehydrogenase (acetylating)/methylmalonate-semialdehyde dehydrogenase
MNFINGKFETTTTTMDEKGIIPIYNPSTNNLLSVIPESSSSSSNNKTAAAAAVTERAIRAAKEAFPSWSNTPVQNRQRLLLEYAHLLHKKEVREEIA